MDIREIDHVVIYIWTTTGRHRRIETGGKNLAYGKALEQYNNL